MTDDGLASGIDFDSILVADLQMRLGGRVEISNRINAQFDEKKIVTYLTAFRAR